MDRRRGPSDSCCLRTPRTGTGVSGSTPVGGAWSRGLPLRALCHFPDKGPEDRRHPRDPEDCLAPRMESSWQPQAFVCTSSLLHPGTPRDLLPPTESGEHSARRKCALGPALQARPKSSPSPPQAGQGPGLWNQVLMDALGGKGRAGQRQRRGS